MPSISAMSVMAAVGIGASGAGYLGWQHTRDDGSLDTEDRLGYTASSVAVGGIAGLALSGLGLRRSAAASGLLTSSIYRGLNTTRKGLMANPLRATLRRMGRKNFGWKSLTREIKTGARAGERVAHIGGTTLKLSALVAATIGLVAYGASTRESGPVDYATRDDYSGSGTTVKERMGMLGATGDVVLGLNTLRHG